MKIDNPVLLLVDDSESDALLMETVYTRAGFTQPLRFVHDGEEAIAYLGGDGAFANRIQFPMPTAVLLDLKMPRVGGFDVLAWVRTQPALVGLRVYMLSASTRPEDIDRAYELGADAYLVKPGNLDGLMRQASCLLAWLRLVRFPQPRAVLEANGASPALQAQHTA